MMSIGNTALGLDLTAGNAWANADANYRERIRLCGLINALFTTGAFNVSIKVCF
jgi:hypothetical protein